MSKSSKREHHTELQSASIVSSGSGDILVGGGFSPTPNVPVNGSNLPNRFPDFVGRGDAIRHVMDALASRAWIVTIDGVGGIGKTTLALEIAHLCKEHHADFPNIPRFEGFIWTSARDQTGFSLDDVTREILYVLSPYEARSRDLDRTEQLSLAVRALASKPRLLIIDNFETVNDEHLHRFLRDQIPDPSKVLITSRHHIQAGEKVVNIGGLDPADAIEMLRLEASRLQIPLEAKDTTSLHIIAQKSYGIPLVLRWVMESVYNGKSLQWALESLEQATAEDIFDYIFNRSLSLLDTETRLIFRSLSLLPTWSSLGTIAALNPGVVAIQERVSQLVRLSLVEDNRSLVSDRRRYRLPQFTQYLAIKEFSETPIEIKRDRLHHALKHYSRNILKSKKLDKKYVMEELPNIENILKQALASKDYKLVENSVELVRLLRRSDHRYGTSLSQNFILELTRVVTQIGDKSLILKTLEALGNAYVYRGPTPTSMFFGREDLLSLVEESFERGARNTPFIFFVGLRKIGKTSFLRQIIQRETDKCVYVYVDIQGIGTPGNSSQFFYYLAETIHRDLTRRGYNIPILGVKDLSKNAFFEFDDFIRDTIYELGDVHLVLVIDEFDVLYFWEQSGELMSYIRHLLQHSGISMIAAGASSSVVNQPGSPLFNVALVRRVPVLSKNAAIELIKRPSYGLVDYSQGAIDTLLSETGRHPSLLQEICYLLIQDSMKRGELNIGPELVLSITSDFLHNGAEYFNYLMRQMSDSEQKLILVAASLTEQNKADRVFSFNQLMEKSKLESSKLLQNLYSLITSDLLIEEEDKRYIFSIDMFRRWVLKTHVTE
jgi:hypothetical protein